MTQITQPHFYCSRQHAMNEHGRNMMIVLMTSKHNVDTADQITKTLVLSYM